MTQDDAFEYTTRYLLFMLLTAQFLCIIRCKPCHSEGNCTFSSNPYNESTTHFLLSMFMYMWLIDFNAVNQL